MDEVAAQAALHHPVGGHGRVEPAREEHERTSARADREPAGASQALGRHEQLLAVHLHVRDQVRVRQVHVEAEPHPHRVADHPRELDGAEREALVAPCGADGEGAPGAASQQRHRGVGRRGGVALAPDRALHDAHAGQREAAVHELVLIPGARDDEHAAPVPDLESAQIGRQPAQVALQRVHEQRPVAALERELAELEQHAALSANLLHMA